MGNEVKIKLTDAQKAKIKEATGRDLPEIRVESFGASPGGFDARRELAAQGDAGDARRQVAARGARPARD